MVQVEVARSKSLFQFTSLAAAAQGYLFRPGGAYTLAICRMALFICLYIHVTDGLANGVFAQGGVAYLAASNIAAYNPKSLVWFFFPNAPPSAGVIDACVLIAKFTTVMAIVGLFTRVSMMLSVLSLIFLASLSYSWEPLWSHPYNGELLAGIGFMFGRAGDTLSLDSLISRFVFRKRINLNRNVYWWPVILGQFGAAALYFGGFYAKWSGPDFHYDLFWVFSDNFRNSVVLPWLI